MAACSITVFSSLPVVGISKAKANSTTGGYSSATGSSDTAVTVTTLAQLQNAFNAGNHHIIISGNIYGGSSLTTLTFASTSWNNTTIEGAAGTTPVLQNIQLKFDGELLPTGTNIQNIVVKNITFYGNITDLQNMTSSGPGINYEGISFRRVTNAWVDHCTIYNTSDDLFSIALQSDLLTVSYCHFYFTSTWLNMNPDPIWTWPSGTSGDLATERLAAVFGVNLSDSNNTTGALHITLHHNWFVPNMKGRPLVRGFVHAYNNYFDNSTTPSGNNAAGYSQTQWNAFQIGSGGTIYSESNYYYKTNNSVMIGLDNTGDPYNYVANPNGPDTFDQTTHTNQSYDAPSSTLTWSTPWSSYYTVTPEAASLVPNDVQAHAGPFGGT
jgi:pectate lyase